MKALENKIPPLIVFAISAIFIWLLAAILPTFPVNEHIKIIVVSLFALLGVALAGAGVLVFKNAKTTVNPFKPETASQLVDKGVYRISRNPMYTGLAMLLLAWCVYLSSIWSLAGLVLYVVYMNRFQIMPEENALQLKFGEHFSHYKSRVRRWI